MAFRKVAFNVFLALTSFCAAVILGEIGFRTLLFSDYAFMDRFRAPGLYADPMSDDDYWKLQYLFDREFPPPAKPHPLLGWVGNFSRDTYTHDEIQHVGEKRPVLFYGDSFAGCVALPCFQQMLNAAEDFSQGYYFLNYGVGGYGVDQIYLLLKNSIPLYKDPFVVVSIMTEDLDRTLQSVRVGQKPYFEVAENRLVLRGTPMDPDPAAYFAQHPPEIVSYLYRLLTHSDLLPWRLREYLNGEKEARRKKLLVNKHIIVNIIEELRARKLDFVFLIFHPKAPPVFDDWRDTFLKKLLSENRVPLLSTREIVGEDALRSRRDLAEYYIKGDGHPTALQNVLVAKELKTFILANGAPEQRESEYMFAERGP
jgi:hypothetical protein